MQQSSPKTYGVLGADGTPAVLGVKVVGESLVEVVAGPAAVASAGATFFVKAPAYPEDLSREYDAYERLWDRGVSCVALLIPLAEGGPLSDVLGSPDLPPEERSSLLVAVVSALREINVAGVCHMDIKPAHIFVARAAPSPRFKVTVIDFGLSAIARRDEEGFALLFVFHELEYGPLQWRRTIADAGTRGERLSAACLAKLRTLGSSSSTCYDLVLADSMVTAKEPLPSEGSTNAHMDRIIMAQEHKKNLVAIVVAIRGSTTAPARTSGNT
eukprot:m51a1_g14540 hypothetical protein (271) ;mRNA; f:955360-959651